MKKLSRVCIVFILTTLALADDAAENTGRVISADELLNNILLTPPRVGPIPEHAIGIPHQQHSQNAPTAMQQKLAQRVQSLPGVVFKNTPFSLPGSVGWRLHQYVAKGSQDAFIRQTTEFAHQHIPADGSLHMLLPNRVAQYLLTHNWGVLHPLSSDISGEHSEYLLVFGPRNETDLNAIWLFSLASYYQATGVSIRQ